MTSKPKTPLDLELNLFENSFASKDLLNGQQQQSSEPPAPAASGSSLTTQDSSNNLSLHTASSSGSSGPLDASQQPPPVANTKAIIAANPPQELGPAATASAKPEHDETSSNGSNKHNLRISNIQGLNADRPLGLTPPLFTPGGRRLPPIHLSPGGHMGTPETPGTSMWSSLLNATGSNPQAGDPNATQYAHPGLNPYFSSMRKSGLVPTESNLRSGLTPGLMNHGNGYFNLPESLGNGQMTPGLQTLLGLNSNPSIGADGAAAPPPAQAAINSGYPIPLSQGQVPGTVPEINQIPPPPAPKQEPEQPEPKEEPTGRKSAKREAPASKQPARKASKSNSGKADKKSKEESKSQASSPEEGDKRKQFLERNRVAASKCRQRKKQLFNKMESELSFYSNGFRELSGQVTSLRNHLNILKNVLQSQKDNPAVANAVGGFQQLHSILSQADFLTHSTTNAESNLSSIPSTIPTTLNPTDQQGSMSGGVMNQMDPGTQMTNAPIQNIGGLVVNPTENGTGSDAPSRAGEAMNSRGHSVDDGPLQYHNSLAKHYTPDGIEHGAVDMNSSKDNLRPINSTSNLQNVKMAGNGNGYDLRPIASMADMHSHANGEMPKQFHLG